MPHLTRRPHRWAAALLTLALGLASAALATPADATDQPSGVAPLSGYVALGDSYASGEGLAPYESGTDTGADRCHRSSALSYPELLEAGPDPAFDHLTSAACSGAVTTSIFASKSAEPAQLRALSATTRTVTLSIGGNDAGFSEILSSCIWSPVDSPAIQALIPGRTGCRKRLNATVSTRIGYLGRSTQRTTYGQHRSIPGVIAAIHRRAPQATIYLTGYPQLVGSTSNSPYGCRVATFLSIPLVISDADIAWMRRKTSELDLVMARSVAQARLQGVDARFVDLRPAFDDHQVCDTGTPWLNPLLVSGSGVSSASFHPTDRGQQAYADVVTQAASAD